MVGHLENIDDTSAETLGEIQAIRANLGYVMNYAHSCEKTLWAIAVMLFVLIVLCDPALVMKYEFQF